jgi:hypothetical protein
MEKQIDIRRWCWNCGEKIPYDSPIDLCSGCEADANDTDMHPQTEEEPKTCPTCCGCGEGQFEGTRCTTCGGKGTLPTEAQREAAEDFEGRAEMYREMAEDERRGI